MCMCVCVCANEDTALVVMIDGFCSLYTLDFACICFVEIIDTTPFHSSWRVLVLEGIALKFKSDLHRDIGEFCVCLCACMFVRM